jgi:hypothetical protein
MRVFIKRATPPRKREVYINSTQIHITHTHTHTYYPPTLAAKLPTHTHTRQGKKTVAAALSRGVSEEEE